MKPTKLEKTNSWCRFYRVQELKEKSTVVSKRFRASKSQSLQSQKLSKSKTLSADQTQAASITKVYTTKMPFSKSKVANSTATGPLSRTEEKTAQKYRKMKKMGLPEGAILHKMIADGVPAHIRDNVMAGEEESNTSQGARAMGKSMSSAGGSQSSLSSQEEKIAAQYRKMLRFKMPRAAVSHKMSADGVPQKIQDSVMNGDEPQASSSSTSQSRGGATGRVSSLSTADEKVAAPYRKMIRMKMPQGAVRHKMTADGVSQHIQDSVLSGEVPSTSSSSSQSSSRGGATGPVSSLSKQDEKLAAPYRKMMRMKMPEGAVRHKMTADGVSQHIQDSVLAKEVPNDGSDGGDNAPAPPMRRPVNPMAAAISSSGGIGSLKKTEDKSGESSARPSSNPTAALIAGGIGSLKKTTVNERKPEASNPLLAAINASGGRSGLKKTPPKANNSSTHTTSSGNSLLDELSSKGFGSSLRRTPPKKVSRPQPKSSIFMSVGDELSSDGMISRSTQSRNTQTLSYQSSDFSSSESSDEDAFGIEVSLQAEEPKVTAPVSRRYAGMKVKGVRATGTARPEGSFGGNGFPKERPSRYSSKAKTVTPAGTVQVNELSVRKSCGTNNDYRPTRAYPSKAKTVRQWPPPRAEEPPEKSNNVLKNYSPKRSPERKNRFAKQPEEQRQSNGSFESPVPRQEKRHSEASIISMTYDKPPRSTSSTTHTSTTIGTLDAANLEKDFAKAVQASIRTRTMKTADMSGRSASRSKHWGSEWNNDRLARRHQRTYTTADGVDHHCNCIIM